MRLQLFAVIFAAVGTMVCYATQQDSATQSKSSPVEVATESDQPKTTSKNIEKPAAEELAKASNVAEQVDVENIIEEDNKELVKIVPSKVASSVASKVDLDPTNSKVTSTEENAKEENAEIVESDAIPEQSEEDEVSTNQASATTVGALADTLGTAQQKGIFGTAEVSFSTDLKEFGDDSKTTSASFFARPRYRLNSDYTLRANFWVDKGLSQGFEDQIRDTRVGVARNPIKLADKLLFSPNITLTLPTSEVSKRNQELILGAEANGVFIYTASNLLTFIYIPRARKNFHEYETSRTDVVNTEYSLANIFVMSYALADKWIANYTFFHSQAWSYQDTARDPSYLNIFDLTYTLSKSSYVTFGSITGGALYQAERGPDQTVEFFDENSTSLYTNIGILF